VRTGKSLPAWRRCLPPAVHPRAYGEEVHPHFFMGVRERFTPVRTGKRGSASTRRTPASVHPRAYGEELDASQAGNRRVGSPPCVRGRACRVWRAPRRGRFTPVRTGKRKGWNGVKSRRAVHPRAYGEENTQLGVMLQTSGSPPCVRGRGGAPHRHPERARFTPVRTGKSQGFRSRTALPSVHPRAYGEEVGRDGGSGGGSGSPPCVRGRGKLADIDNARPRFTPVRTGKSA